MAAIRAVVVDPTVQGHLSLQEVASPVPFPSEALVRVAAISLNQGEVRRALTAEAGSRPGWDFAGVVEQQAADGSGPRRGARVVGMLNSAAWAEVLAVPTHILAELPEGVTFAQAATLPVAGLTAYRALEKGGLLIGKRVLITGASGGVGYFAIQLARLAGAHVVGVVHRPERVPFVQEAGADEVMVSADLVDAKQSGPYDFIMDAVGGVMLGNALSMLAPDGTVVSYGSSVGYDVRAEFNSRAFYLAGGANLYGLILFHELARKAGGKDLGILAKLVADGRLRPHIDFIAPWTQITDATQRLLGRSITGKAVLTLD